MKKRVRITFDGTYRFVADYSLPRIGEVDVAIPRSDAQIDRIDLEPDPGPHFLRGTVNFRGMGHVNFTIVTMSVTEHKDRFEKD